MFLIISEYEVSSHVLTKNKAEWQFIDKDLQKQPRSISLSNVLAVFSSVFSSI